MRKKRGFLRKLFLFILAAGLIVSGGLLVWISTFKIPDLSSFEERKIEQSVKIYDRTGEVLLYDLHEDIKRSVVPYEEISRNIKNATVAIEDTEFYEHSGIKIKAFLRAILANLKDLEFSQGGSTITQQVVKNSILTSEKKISRKLKEWVLALKLEKQMTKDEILGLYLNEVPYGGSVYGIEEASNTFFDKDSQELSIAESAYLAALPQAPTYYSPYGNNKEKLEERKNLVLRRMLEESFISEDEYRQALNEEVEFQPRATFGIKAPHFVFYVIEELEREFGKRVLEEGGFKVITTLDYELQEKAEEIVKSFALENTEKFNAENAGLVAVDPKTGDILVMVGSRDYFDEEIDGNFNIAIAHRQPGSAFKPFVYATAFKKGYTPETVVFDLETQFSTLCDSDGKPLSSKIKEDECYTPGNYDNVFRGPVTLRNALAQSINIPAIKTLYLSGLQDSLRTAKDMGIGSLTNIDRYGLTLVLGGGEVTLLDITSAYGVFANSGKRNPHRAILNIEDASGNIIKEYRSSSVTVLSENVALTISDVLSDNVARAPAFGENSYLHFPGRDVAAKTGTTNDYRDAWIIGYTPQIAVGAWAGNNDNSPMEKRVAGFIIAPLWNAFMNEVFENLPNESFRGARLETKENTPPILRGIWQGGETFVIDRLSGKLATEYTPEELREERVIPDIHNILYWVDKNNPFGERPEKPEEDSQFHLWEEPVLKWVEKMNLNENISIPQELDDIHLPAFSPKMEILITKDSWSTSERITFNVSQTGGNFLNKVDLFMGESLVATLGARPFSFSFIPSDIGLGAGDFVVRAVGYDAVLNKGTATKKITLF